MKRLGLWLSAVLLLGAVSCRSSQPSEKVEAPRASVAVAKVSRGPIADTIETYGTAEFAPEHERSVTLVRSGQILNVPVVAGQIVHKGDTLLTVGPMPSGSPALQQARIDADYAKRELLRIQRLVGEKLATNQDLQNAQKQVAAARAGLIALGGGSAGGGARIRASTDGIIARVLVRRGQVVQAGQQALLMAAENSIAVRAGFEVEDLPQLSEGLTVWLEPIYRGPSGARARAELSTLHRVIDPSTQLVEGLIQVPDPPSWLAAGLATRVTVVLRSEKDALRIPRNALIDVGGKQGVYLIRGGHAHWRAVELGIESDHFLEVKKGVHAGDEVATVGRSSLTDGIAVSVEPAAKSP